MRRRVSGSVTQLVVRVLGWSMVTSLAIGGVLEHSMDLLVAAAVSCLLMKVLEAR